MNELSEQYLADLDDVELLLRIDDVVTHFDERDPEEAGEVLGALVQEFGERHSPDAVLAQLRRLLLDHDPEAEVELTIGAMRAGMARRAALRRGTSQG